MIFETYIALSLLNEIAMPLRAKTLETSSVCSLEASRTLVNEQSKSCY